MASSNSNPSTPRRSCRLWGWVALLLAVLMVAAWAFHGWVLSRVVEWGLREGVALAGWRWETGKVQWRLGGPLALKSVEVRPGPEWPGESKSAFLLESADIVWPSPWEMWQHPQRLAWKIRLQGFSGVWDGRTASLPTPTRSATEHAAFTALPASLIRWLPVLIEVEIGELTILNDALTAHLQECRLLLDEQNPGRLTWQKLEVETPDRQVTLAAVSATTAWRDGVFYLGNLVLWPETTIDRLALDAFRPEGMSLSIEAGLWDGWVRGEWALSSENNQSGWDGTLWGGQWSVKKIVALIEEESATEETTGTIDSLRFTFRGNPERWEEAEATLRLTAGSVRWQQRGWQDLVIAASASAGRVHLSQLLLQQEENRLEASGEVTWPLPSGWQDWRSWRGRLQADGTIDDVTALAGLAGQPFGEASGYLKFSTALRLAQGKLEGRVQADGGDWQWQGVALGGARIEARWQGQELEVAELLWENGKDRLTAHGRVRLAEPYVYSAQAEASLTALQKYASLLPHPETEDTADASPSPIDGLAGALDLTWQGDGTWQNHSGAFALELNKVRVQAVPAGLSGRFEGTYSPENAYFHLCELRHDPFTLRWTLSAGEGGVFADGITLQARGREVFGGQIYVPWNPLIFLTGKTWPAGLLPHRNLYADLRSARLELRDLAALIGQSTPVQGKIQLHASAAGPLSSPVTEARLEISDFRSTDKNAPLLVDRGQFEFASAEGRGRVAGAVVIPQIQPVRIEANFPFGFSVDEESLHWVDPLGQLTGLISLPAIDLAKFRSLVPDLRGLAGVVSGEIRLGDSLAQPSIDGEVRLRGGRVETADRALPDITDIQATLRFDGDSFRLENTGAKLGAGPLTISGEGNFSDFSNPRFSFALEGQQILLYRDRRLRLRANMDLAVAGTWEDARLSGSILLVDGRIFQRLEITPLLQGGGPESSAPLLLPDLTGLVPPPLAGWPLDVRIANADPFILVGNVASGSIEPDLRIIGTLGDPRPTGQVVLRELRAYLPFSVVTIPEGHIDFLEDRPRSPELDIRGSSQVLQYEIQILAQGPLEEKNLILRSDPPLSQEQILLLITAGLAPGDTTGSGFGQAAIGQGGLLALKTLARHFEPDGIDVDSLLNRIQVITVPADFPGERPSLIGEFRINDQFSVFSERDGMGLLGGGATYRIRFR